MVVLGLERDSPRALGGCRGRSPLTRTQFVLASVLRRATVTCLDGPSMTGLLSIDLAGPSPGSGAPGRTQRDRHGVSEPGAKRQGERQTEGAAIRVGEARATAGSGERQRTRRRAAGAPLPAPPVDTTILAVVDGSPGRPLPCPGAGPQSRRGGPSRPAHTCRIVHLRLCRTVEAPGGPAVDRGVRGRTCRRTRVPPSTRRCLGRCTGVAGGTHHARSRDVRRAGRRG